MDPNKPVKGPVWDDDPSLTGGADIYCGTTTFADGHKEKVCYRRGTNEEVKREDVGFDKAQQESWTKEQDARKPPGGRTEITEGNRRKGWNPETRQYDKDLGPSEGTGAATPTTTSTSYRWVDTPGGGRRLHIITKDSTGKQISDDEATPAQQQEYEQFERGGSKKTYGAAYRNQAGTWVRPWTDAQGQTGVEPLPPEAVPAGGKDSKYTQIKQDPQTGKWNGLTAEGTWEAIEGGPGVAAKPPAAAPTERPNPADPTKLQRWDGTKGEWVDAGAIRQPVEPPGAPKIDPAPGATASSLLAYSEWLNQQVAAGTVDGATATALMTRRRAEAETLISERSAAETRAAGLLSADVTQRGQDTTTVGQRLSAASTGYNSALSTAQALAKYAKKGSGAASVGFQMLLDENLRHADRFGGRVDIPRAGVAAQLQPYAAQGVGPSPTAGYPGAPAAPASLAAVAAAAGAPAPIPGANGAPGTPVGPFPAPAAPVAPVGTTGAPVNTGALDPRAVTPAPPQDIGPPTVPLAPGGASPTAAWTLPPAPPDVVGSLGALGQFARGGQMPQPTAGNAFAETEAQLQQQGFSPEIIAEARRRFLQQATAGAAAA